MHRTLRGLAPLWMTCLLSACGASGTLIGNAMEATGLRKPAPSDAQSGPRNVSLHLHAAPRLNLDARGRPLAVLVRIYKLRQRTAFAQAPFDAFLSPETERAALGADLIDVRELTLVPGQRLDLDDTLARDAGYLGVVALFRAPAQQGWRIAFAAADAEHAGVTLGVHACSLSVGAGAAASGAAPAPLSLVHCQ